MLDATRMLGGDVHRGLRGAPSGAARARAGRGVERHGVSIFEQTRALSIEPGRVDRRGESSLRGHVVRATEGYTHTLRGQRRDRRPGLLADGRHRAAARATWEQIGLRRRATFSRRAAPDHLRPAHRRRPDRVRRPRGAVPLRLAHPAVVRPRRPRSSPSCARRWSTCSRQLATTRITHAWGGALGIPRDWCASVGLDRATGVGWAGGYVGDGVSTTNLAGRTLRRPGAGARAPTSPACPGSATAPGAGSPSRCAGWASTPACARWPWPTPRSGRPDDRAGSPSWSGGWSADSAPPGEIDSVCPSRGGQGSGRVQSRGRWRPGPGSPRRRRRRPRCPGSPARPAPGAHVRP